MSSFPEKLADHYRRFHHRHFLRKAEEYEELATHGQNPDAMVISETTMKKLTVAATIAIASLITPVLAQGTTSPGASGNTPAAQMKKHDSQGASEYTPGHKYQEKGAKGDAPGASGYAPGHQSKNTGTDRGSSGSSTGTGGNN